MDSTLYRTAAPDAQTAPEPAGAPAAAACVRSGTMNSAARPVTRVPERGPRPQPLPRRVAGALVWLAVWVGTRIILGMRIRRHRRHLMSLSDHMLKDIGLTRAEITHAVYHGRNRGED